MPGTERARPAPRARGWRGSARRGGPGLASAQRGAAPGPGRRRSGRGSCSPKPRLLSCGLPPSPQRLGVGTWRRPRGEPCSRAGAGGEEARPQLGSGKPESDPPWPLRTRRPAKAPGALGRLLSEATPPPAGTMRRGLKGGSTPPPAPDSPPGFGPRCHRGRWELAPGDSSLSECRACIEGLSRGPGARLGRRGGGQRAQPVT